MNDLIFETMKIAAIATKDETETQTLLGDRSMRKQGGCMKCRQVVKLTLSMFVVVMLAFEQRAAESELQPVRVVRYGAGAEVVFRLPDNAAATVLADRHAASHASEATEDATIPAFYLFRTQHQGTIPVAQFVDGKGHLTLVTAPADVDEFRRRGLHESDQPLFVYAEPLEGASELFRLQDPVSGSEIYTVDPVERSHHLAEGWKSLPSLGWTQAIDSTGVGILKPTTIKLKAPELEALKSVREFGRELTFAYTNEVIAALQPGSIVYAEKSEALPLGLVHRVDWVAPASGGGVILGMSTVDLIQAFEEVHLFLQGAPLAFLSDERHSGDWKASDCGMGAERFTDCGSADVGGGFDRAITRKPGTNGVFDSTVKKELTVEWSKKSKGVESKLAITGSSSFGVTIEGQYSDSNSCTLNPVAVFVITPHQEFKVSVQATGSLVKDKEKALFAIRGTVLLSGIPVSADFTVWAGYETAASMTVKATFTQNTQGTAVVRWDAAKKSLQGELCPKSCPSGFRCGPSAKPPSKPCVVGASFIGEAGFEGTASVYLRPEIWVYLGAFGSGVGPYVDAKLQLQARTERYATGVYGQFIPSVGAKMKVGCVEKKLALTNKSMEVQVASIPIAPTGVDASDGKLKGKVGVTWKAVPDVSGYDVFRSTSATGTRTKLNSKLLSSAKYEDSVKAPTKYYYWIRAVTGKMAGPVSKWDVGYAK